MMKCQDAIAHLCDYLDGTLTPEVRDAVQKHVTNCACCPKILESYTKTMSLCQKALRKGAPKEFAESLITRLRDKTSPPRK